MRLPTVVLHLLFAAIIAALPVKYDDKKNIIFLVSDGLGQSGITAARQFKQTRDNLTNEQSVLHLENYLIGSVRTKSSSQLVTDSAAAGSAIAEAFKTYNGAISVDSDGTPKGTFYEGAKLKNYKTGIVSSTFVQDATICTPNTHALSRKSLDLIAEQQLGYGHPLGQVIDVVLGGGRQYLHGENQTQYGSKGKRKDGVDYIAKAQEDGWTYIGNRTEFDTYNLGNGVEPKLPLLGIFGADKLPYEIDRINEEVPSLKELSLLALNTLIEATKDQEEGFVLLLEGARIDHAGHSNDPVAHARDVIEYDETWKAVIDRVSSLDTETIVVSTSDHETGGYALGIDNVYDYYPDVLLNATMSTEKAIELLKEYEGDDKAGFLKKDILQDAFKLNNVTDEEVNELLESKSILVDIGHLVSKQAGVGWTSTGHTAVDVPIFAWSNTKEAYNEILANLGSSIENTEIPEFFAKYIDVNLDEVTDKIQEIETGEKVAEKKK
ncbi:Alkaline phosphatase [Wickerhamomyces ciferrii]|uniref:alkaline phosphatase n=1 Tax=Wickerhamomyces ciferrii (strain ATCC 14091 / BCRC 22168 / CBS 111 / JCM 3599 / NBRC 0793 / NRRL Y-1031 F-60-10) TaxID=1206466 RepID=K0KL50_WICCF|nr:Alkaline phosphatase [Wickerhamomyces ciferrii]CCH45965.1 Alkaline phosphatase [Wickerhamomyces ciferrii]